MTGVIMPSSSWGIGAGVMACADVATVNARPATAINLIIIHLFLPQDGARRTNRPLPTAGGNTRAASTHSGSASNNSATSYDCAAAVNSDTSSVGSPTAILIVRITIATSVVAAAHNCCAANNGPPSNGRSTTINRSTAINRSTTISAAPPNCGASIGAAASDGSSLSLQSLAIYGDTVWKD